MTVTLTADTSTAPAYLLGEPSTATAAVEDDDDSPATGAVTITGTATEGETLSADTSGLTDGDGLANAAYAYQWVRTPTGGSEADISGATGATYVPVFADAGATLKVKVTVTDDEGHEAEFESAATSAVAALPRPSVTVASDDDVTEGSAAVFTLTRTGDPAEELDVAYEVAATGDFGVTTGASTATFPANSATVQVSVATTGDSTHEAHGSVTVTLTADTSAEPAYLIGDPSTATAAVEGDDDSPATGSVTVTTATTFTEGETLTADTSGLADADGLANAAYVYQWVRTPSGGSEADISGATDATYVPVFADAGATLKVKVTVTDDEGHEATFTSAPTSAVAAALRPSVTVVSDGDVTEGDTVTFTLTRTGDPAEELDVAYEVAATGDFGATTGAGTATFLANDATVQVSVATTGDGVHEVHGSVTVTLTADTSADPAYLLGDSATATAAVRDDDDAPATGSVTVTGTPTEGETLTADTSGLTDADGLADAAWAYQWVRTPSGGSDEDISGATSQTYVPVFADAGATLKVKVTVTDDEGHEATFTSAATSAVAALPRPSVTVVSDGDVMEGDTVTFTLTRTGDPAQTLEVAYEVAATGDFGAATGAGTATFLANDATVQVSVTTTGDDSHETHGTVTVTLTADTGVDPAYLLGEPAAATAAVRDDDDAPATGSVTITGTATEGETLTADTSGLTDGDGLANAAWDYQWVRTPSGGSDEDISGATSQTYVPVFADAGATLKVKVTVTDVEGHEATFESAATATVEAASRPSVTVVSDGDVTEGDTVTFTLTRTGDPAEELDVAYEVTATGDFGVTAGGEATATFLADSSTVQVSVATTGDGAHEAHGSVTVTLTADTSAEPSYLLGDPSTATATVEDDDTPTVSIGAPAAAVAEGGTLRFPLTLNRAGYRDITLDYAVTGGTAEAGDYTDAGGGTLTIPAGDTTAHIELGAVDDTVDEPDEETVEVTISNPQPSGAATIGTATATGTITDNDAAPTVTLVLTPASITEAAGQSTVTATLDHPSSEATTVTVTVTPVAPAMATDYTLSANLELTIPAGATESEGVVTITAANNTVDAPDKTVTVSATATNDRGVTNPQDVTLTITDDDLVELSVDDVSVAEGDSGSTTLQFTVTLDPAATGEVTVDWATADGTAQAGTDYTSGSGSLTFGVGETSKTVTVTVTGDDVDEPNETFTVALSNVSGATLVKATGTGTITDDDDTPTVSLVLTPASITEAAGQSTVTARLDHPSSEETTVTVAAPESPAVAGDYTLSANRVLTIAAGATTSTGAVTITAVDNAVDAPNKAVTVSATAENTRGVTAPQDVTLTIRDDENVAPTGAPTIDDTTPVVGETLTADPSGIVDSDGLTGATYAYRWVRVASGGTETEIGTGSSYTVVAGDVGSTLKVEASFTDDGGAEETVESAPTSAVAALPRPSVTVAPRKTPVSEGDPAAEFTVTRTGDTTAALRVRISVSETGDMVSARNEGEGTRTLPAGQSQAVIPVPTVKDSVHEADSVVTLALVADPAYELGTEPSAAVTVEDDDNAAPTGTVTIDDTTPKVGETLTASSSGVDDPDGLTSPTYAWQWVRTSGGTETEIAGATSASYTVAAADGGAKLKVELSFTDDDGTTETLTSAETAVVPPSVTVAPRKTPVSEGDPAAEFTVTRTGDTSAALRVRISVSETGDMVSAGNEGEGTRTLPAGHPQAVIPVPTVKDSVHEADSVVTLTLVADAAYELGTERSAAVTVEDDDDSPATGTVTIDDTTPTEGETLTADTSGLADGDGLDDAVWAYQWVRTPAGGSDEDISGATGATYVPVFADAGATLKVRVTVTDDEGHEATFTSAATSAVAATPRPVVTVVSDGDVTEGSAAEFTLTRTVDPAETLEVAYEVTATGDFGVTTGAGTATFLANGSTVQVSVDTTGDDTHEAHGSVTVTLTADGGADPAYLLGDPSAATAAVEDDDDSPATGTVTVTGTAAEGETLTADTSGLTDADGLADAAYAYQWVRTPAGGSGADISGATSQTYTPVLADGGTTLKVRVTVTDDEGHEATFTSAATAVVPPSVTVAPRKTPVSEGDPAAEFTVTRTGDTTAALRVRISVSETGDMVSARNEGEGTRTLPAGQPQAVIPVPTVKDSVHEADSVVTLALVADPAYELGTEPSAAVTVEDDDNAAPTGTVTIDDTTPKVGETLTASSSGVDDPDGLTSPTYAWQWVRTSGGTETEIAGATSASYTVAAADGGAKLKVELSFTDDDGTTETLTSAETAVVPPSVTVAPRKTPVSEGDPAAEFTLTRTGDTTEALRVRISVSETGDMVSAGNEGEKTRTLPAGQSQAVIPVPTVDDSVHEADSVVTLTLVADPAYELGTERSAAVTVEDDDDSPATGTVTIDDTTPTEGETLSADTSGITDGDGLADATWAYQWGRTPSGGDDADISGATGATYVPVFADAGATLKVRVTVTDDEGHEATFTSAATSAVAATPRPVVTVVSDGDVTEGDTVTFTLTRTGDPAQTLEVAYEVAATGDFGAATGAGTATFLADSATVQVSVATTGDGTHEAHGTVTVTGTAAEGETLTADTSGLTDGDGLADAAWAYQWVRTPSGGSGADISGATGATYVPVLADGGTTLKVRVTVTDDEGHEATFTSAETAVVPPSVTVAPRKTPVSEGDPAAEFTVTRTGDTTAALRVRISVSETGDMVSAGNEGEKTRTLPAGQPQAVIPVPTVKDSVHEADSVVTLALVADAAYELGTERSAAVTVEDDDDSPATGTVTVTGTPTEGETLSADTSGLTDGDGLANAAWVYQWVRTPSGGSDADISGATSQTYVPVFADAGATLKVKVTVTDDEGHEATFTSAPTSAVAALPRPSVTVTSDGDVTEGSPAVFTLTRTGATAGTLEVAYEVAATGDFGVTTGAGTATFLTNSATVQVSVDTTGDATHEAHGTVTVTLTADTGVDPAYLLGAPSTATAAVRDDDNAAPTGAVTIDDTTPVVGETLTADASSLDDPDGLTSRSFTYQWLRVSGGTETEIAGASAASYTVADADVGATLKVRVGFTDDDGTGETVESAQTSAAEPPSPVLTVAAGTTPVTEGTAATFTVTRTVVTAGALTAHYRVSETGDAVAASDEGAKSVDFADGVTEQTVTVPTVKDTVHEADSVVTVTLTADAAYDLGTATAEVTVEDDDNASPTGTVTIDDTTPVVGQTLTADTSNLDDPDGLTSRSFTYQWLRVSGGTETPIAGATAASYTVADADVGATLKVEVGFTDDDGTGETVESVPTGAVAEYTIAAASPTVTEGDDGVTLLQFALTRSETGQRVEIGWRVATEGTARPVTDFDGRMEGTLVFPPNTRSGSVYLQVIPDIVDESDETVVLELFSVAGTPDGVTFPATVTGTIVDDDTATLSIAPSSVDEGDSGTRDLVFTVSLDLESDREVTVEYDVGGTAESGTDYEAPTPARVTFPVLSWEPQKITFRVLGDTDAERHETVAVELRDPTGGAVLGTSRAEGTIRNDDGLVLSVAPPEVDEGDSTEDGVRLTFRLTLSEQSDTDVTVDYRVDTGAGTATVGSDFRNKSGTETIKSGRTDAVVKVGIVEDTEFELDETVVMVFENPEGAVLDPGSTRVTGTIRNDDLPRVTVAAVAATVTEGAAAVFRLRRPDVDTSEALEVSFTVADSGGVLAGTAPATATIAAGETEETVSLDTVDDGVHEAHGSVTLTLTAGAAYGLGSEAERSAEVTVRDDDDSPATGAVTVTGTATEGETLTADTSGLTDADGLANAAYAYQWVRTPSGGSDADISGATGATYVPVFADAGATLKVEVTVTDDEGHQASFTSAPTSAVAAAPRPSVTVASDGDVTEGSAAVFTLTRTGDPAQPLDVAYAVTATGDFGVTPGASTATFPANSATVQASVATTGDATHEAHGSVTLTLTADTAADPAYLLGDPAAATAAVEDDDDAPATGAVTITGTATEGETLTADTSGLTDADGLANAAWAYQWVRTPSGGSDEDISGATSKTYVPVFADAGATLKVRVTVTDGEGHEATFTSAATSAVAALPEVTVVSDGDVTEGSAAAFTLTRTGGSSAPWLIVNIQRSVSGGFGVVSFETTSFPAGATTTRTRLHVADDEADEAHGAVTLTVLPGNGYRVGTPSAATAKIFDATNVAPTGAPTIDDTSPVVGEMLTADPSGIADADGLTSRTFTWQWVRVSGGTETPIDGATAVTYTVVAADVGATLKVKASFTDDGGIEETVESAATVEAASLPTVTVAPVTSPVVESEDAQFTVTRTGVTTGALRVRYNVIETGAMVRSGDKGAKTVDFSGDTVSVTVTVPTVSDNLHEGNSRVTVTLTADAAYELGTDATARVVVKDDDDSPATGTVTVTGTAREGETLTANTSGIADEDGGLDTAAYVYQWVRTPAGGSDADISGATSKTYVPVFADAGATLKVKVTVTDGEGHEATFTSAATSAVAALPRPSVTVASDGDVTEGSPALFTLTRTGSTAETLDVAYAVTATGDFGVTPGAGTATFLANSATVQVTVATTGDSAHETHGTVTVTLTADTGADPAYLLGDPATATAAVEDDDNAAPTGAVTIDDTTPVVGETLTADASSLDDPDGLTSRSFTYQWLRVSGGTETEITGATAVTYTVVAADVGAKLKVKATFTDDGGIEETVESAQTSAAKPPSPVLTVAAGTSRVTEGTVATFTVTRTVVTAGALTAHYQVSETGDAVAASDEGAKSVDFADGETGKTVTVPTAGDGGHEADSVVTVMLTADAAYELGAQRSAEVTVEDDDNAAPTGAVTIDDTTPVAGQTLSADASGVGDPDGLTDRRFAWQWLRVSGGTATAIAGATSASYTVAAADIGSALKVRAGFTDDDGTGETVESAPTGAVAEYTITAASPRVTEGDDGSALLDFALTRSETGQRVELGWRVTTEGTARPVRPVTDFGGPMEGTLVFSPNTRSRSVYLQVIPDIVDESDETVVLEFFSVAGTPEGVTFPARVTGTIVDDDTATLSIASTSVDEGDSGTRELVFTVSLDLESDREVTVEYDVGGTAESGTDYEAPTPVLVTFPALFWEPQRIVFRVLGDTDAERHETVTVELRDPSGGVALGTSQATATIRNDDGLVVSVDPPEVAEGDSHADGARLTFRLALSGQADTDVTVDYRVDAGAGTATAGSDFKDKSGTATIKSGRTFAVVKLGILEDTAIEPDETVVMVFENPRGAVLDPDSARVTGTILDDDLSLVTVAAEAGPVTEGEDAVFVLTRTGDTSAPLTVTVDVSEAGHVLAGTAPTEATFGASETAVRLRVATEDDATAEADGRVTATVIAGSGYTVAAGAGSAGVDVFDNDEPAAPGEMALLWATTMTVADLDGSVGASGSDLADPDWSEDGVDYALELLRWLGSPDGRVEVRFDSRPPLAEELTLHAGELTLALAEGGSGRALVWPVEGEPWSVGEEVELRLTRTVAGEDQDGAAGPGVSVADARVNESAGTPLAFQVTLAEAQTAAVSVRYATSDGSAVAGADYVAASGMVRFEAGETVKTVDVVVLEDAHDEGEETLTLTLSRPFGAEVSDGVATGTIVNTDALPRAWLGRFGRTVAGQVVDAVEARMTATRQAGAEVSVAGQPVVAAGAFDEAASRDGDAAGGRLAGWQTDPEALDMAARDAALAGGADAEERTVSGRELLTGTSFALTEGTAESGFFSLWGRGMMTDFDGRDGELSVDGAVATGLLGADYTRADWAAGLIVGHSRGEGSYRGQGAGTVWSSLTGLYPWGRWELHERVTVWGVAGYGVGTLTLEPEGQARIETDMDLAMASAGLRGVLLEAPAEGGVELAAKTDGLIVLSTSEAARGLDGGMLEAARAQVTRLRLGLEGTRAFRSEGGGTLTPSFGLGVRHDEGDAETGFGVEVGAGLAYADPSSGLTADLRGRGLLTHQASGFREVGFSGSLAFDPFPSSDRGLSLSLSQTLGASATGGVDALYGRATMAGLGGADAAAGPADPLGRHRLEARVGYGLSAFGGRFTGTPELGFGLSESGRDYRLGWRLTPEVGAAGSFEFSLAATRHEAANDDESEHGAELRATMRW